MELLAGRLQELILKSIHTKAFIIVSVPKELARIYFY